MKYGTALLWRIALLTLGLSSPALAVDGVLEINQACADNTGCFSGDAAGLPVTIDGTAGRSYRLTSDLVVPTENTDAISVNTQSVSIDLNGFEIVGLACVGATSSTCRPGSGTGSGVEVPTLNYLGISVRNGSITGMGNFGVSLGSQAEVTNLRVRWNRVDGIYAGAGSTVSGNTAYQNGGNGIYARSGSTVSGNTAYLNGGIGMNTTDGSTVSGNTARNNGDDGIQAGGRATVSGNTASLNAAHGIHASGDGSTVSGNTASSNGGNGIYARSGMVVSGNTVHGNTGYGLQFFLGTYSAYSGNVISSNTAGTVHAAGAVEFGQNVCNGNTTCP